MPNEEEDNNDEDEDELTRTGLGDQHPELRERPVEMCVTEMREDDKR